jgi:spore cortex biosynthesis protein YabQ
MEFVKQQLSSSLILLLTGMVFGGFFDLYRVFRGVIKVNKMVDLVGDLLFWVLVLFLITPLIYWGTWLELRFYVWVSLGAGLALYYWLFSPALIPVYLRFWRLMGWFPRQAASGTWRLWLFFRKIGWLLTAKHKR